MEELYIQEKTFEKTDFASYPLAKGEYERCSFLSCDFSNGNLGGFIFSNCEFSACNLSLVKLNKTVLRDVLFRDCKMLGLHFENCDQFIFSVSFDSCVLGHASFYQVSLKNTKFRNTKLLEADFTETNLAGAVLDACDLTGATFEHTNLEKADLRTSSGYSIDPALNRIRKAKFSISGVVGLLNKYDIEIDFSN